MMLYDQNSLKTNMIFHKVLVYPCDTCGIDFGSLDDGWFFAFLPYKSNKISNKKEAFFVITIRRTIIGEKINHKKEILFNYLLDQVQKMSNFIPYDFSNRNPNKIVCTLGLQLLLFI